MLRLIPIALLALAAACGSSSEAQSHPRCAQCGMYADMAPRWMTGWGEGENAQFFDGPKCLFRWTDAQSKDRAEAWATEYYSQNRRPASSLVYVIGSDVLSPMGDDLVPIEGQERATQFAADHGGRVIPFSGITPDVLRSLDPQ